MKLEFQEYQARKILNVHKHVDAWFWDKYSAHPYIGCRSGCEFCYLRGGFYLGKRLPETFDTLIQVKTNAAELLRHELNRLPRDVIACGDWQEPAETHYQLSREMLKVVNELEFPLLIIERSPLLVRDLDLLCEINQKVWVGVVISLSSLDQRLKAAFEPRSPGTQRRMAAMEKLAGKGILVGAGLMPILPHVGDDVAHLEEVVRAVKDFGGSFILAGGLSMAGIQAERTLHAGARLDVQLESRWKKMYNWQPGRGAEYSPPRDYTAQLGKRVREICARYDLPDRMPRFIPEGKMGVNKRIAELLFLKTYQLEIEQAELRQIWAYRKAAWTVDEMKDSIVDIYQFVGEAGIRSLPDIGNRIASEIGMWLNEPEVLHQKRIVH
ncbi:MAG: hypothetical protein A2Z16_09060 [Chloroflexi bacterium RBG_16_54_18]|nr:MAG: hypothetical protein A2Z16_09060 [Chloroflexi bacterium RBG_16_54_18]